MHRRFGAATSTHTHTIAFVGDSHAARLARACPRRPDHAGRLSVGYIATDRAARRGLTAGNADIRWLRSQLDGVLRDQKTDFVVVSVGGNTLWPRRKDGGWAPPADASGAMAECHVALRQILEQVELSRKKALVLSIIPRCTADAELLELTDKVNSDFESMAFTKGAAFISVPDALAVELEASGEMDDVNFEDDGTHLTREAERKVWASIKEAVNKPLWG